MSVYNLQLDLVRDGAWSGSPDWCYRNTPLVELHGLTKGIVGYGAIGRAVGGLQAFGMKVKVTTQR
jgi:glycerate dehydrogenase